VVPDVLSPEARLDLCGRQLAVVDVAGDERLDEGVDGIGP